MMKGFTVTVCTGSSATVAPLRPIWKVPPGMLMNSGVKVTRCGGGSLGFSAGALLGAAVVGVGVGCGQKIQAPIPPPSSRTASTAAIQYGSRLLLGTAPGYCVARVGELFSVIVVAPNGRAIAGGRT